MFNKYFIVLILLSPCLEAKVNKNQIDSSSQMIECSSTREYVTALEYLRERKEFQMEEGVARDLANKVSDGCSGAGKRFIQSTSLLLKAGLDSRNALEVALKLAKTDDKVVDNFSHLFKLTFTPNYLDLSVGEALDVAIKLSLEFKGEQLQAKNDFQKLVDFCISTKGLDLPKNKCSELAVRITKLGEHYKNGVAKSFFEIFDFLNSKRGGNQTMSNVLKLAETVVAFGPLGVENFITAYKYATSEKGMNLDESKSIDFSLSMAKKTIRNL
jgi:hypothetical protein